MLEHGRTREGEAPLGGHPYPGARFRRGIEAKLSPTTSRQLMALLAGIFADAVEDGLLAESPCRGTVPPRPQRKKVVPLTVEQVEALVRAAPDRYRALMVLGAGSGLRLGEALGLKVGRVRFLERELDVVEQLTLVPGAPPKLAPSKTRGSVRTVPSAGVVATALAEHLAAFPLDRTIWCSDRGQAAQSGQTHSIAPSGSHCASGRGCRGSGSMTCGTSQCRR